MISSNKPEFLSPYLVVDKAKSDVTYNLIWRIQINRLKHVPACVCVCLTNDVLFFYNDTPVTGL